MTLSMKYELCSPLWLMLFNPDSPPPTPAPVLPISCWPPQSQRKMRFFFSISIKQLFYDESEPLLMGGNRSFSHPGERAVLKRCHVCQLFGIMHKRRWFQIKKKKEKRWQDVSRADNGAVVKNAACGGSNLKWLGKRWHLPRLDLQSYQAEVCWRCSTWFLPALLWQRTGLDHWRWLGDLRDRDVGGL